MLPVSHGDEGRDTLTYTLTYRLDVACRRESSPPGDLDLRTFAARLPRPAPINLLSPENQAVALCCVYTAIVYRSVCL